MAWVKLDDAMPKHPKTQHLSDRAFRVHIEALCYAAHYLTDGAVEALVAKRERWDRDADALVTAGVWELRECGWYIHDYLVYNPSRAQVLKEREQTKRRLQRFRNGSSNAVTNGAPDPLPHPHPDPDPQGSEIQNPPTPHRGAHIDAEFREAMYGRFPTQTRQRIDELIETAQGHASHKKSTNKQAHVRNWLVNELEVYPAERAAARHPPRTYASQQAPGNTGYAHLVHRGYE